MYNQNGDPKGVSVVNLGKESLLYGLNPSLFRGVFSDDRAETVNAHKGENQLYGISNSIFKADVFISIPKLKSHHKVGTTLNLKGLVGTMGIKNYLVHWRMGFPFIGGDEYPNFLITLFIVLFIFLSNLFDFNSRIWFVFIFKLSNFEILFISFFNI